VLSSGRPSTVPLTDCRWPKSPARLLAPADGACDRPQHVGSELDDFEDELKEDADEHEDEIDPDVDEDENEPAPSPAHRPDSLPPLLTNYLLPPLSLDEMRTKIEDDYYAVLLKSLLTRLIEAHDQQTQP
jgi:hypothetical protein